MLELRLGLGFIADSNLSPTDIAWAGTHTVAEDAALGAVIGGALSATDPEGGPVIFSLTDDNNGLFGISGTSIIVTGVLDFETTSSHTITVRATDNAGKFYDKMFSITVTDVSETPPANPPPDGDVVDDGTFTNPPIVVDVDGGIKFSGKKASGSSGKFIFDIGAAVANRKYTIQYDPDFSLLAQQGKLALVGFGFKQANDFHIVGLKGDGSTGLDAFKIHGDDLWNQTGGFTTDNGGDADHGTQAGPNWLQIVMAADGNTYTLRTSSNGTTWTDEYTGSAPTPFADVADATTFGIAAFFDSTDAGPFSVKISLWLDEAAGDPHFSSVVFLSGFEGADGSTTFDDESSANRAMTAVGNAQIDTAQSKFGSSSLLLDGTGDAVSMADSADWQFPGEFTIEGFFRHPTIASGVNYSIFSQYGSAGNRSIRMFLTKGASTSTLGFTFSTDGTTLTHSLSSSDIQPPLADNTWFHWAVDRDASNKLRVYFEGVMVASKLNATGTNFNSTAAMLLGQETGLNNWNGHMDEIRFTKGVARYASDAGLTPPVAAFPRS